MRTSIRTKILLLVSALLLLIFGVITVFQIRSSTNSLRTNLFEESKAFASLATQPIGNVYAIYKDSGTLKIKQQIDQFSKLNKNITNVFIVNVAGEVVYAQNQPAVLSITKEEASTFEPIYRTNQSKALSDVIFPYFEGSGSHRFSIVYTVSDQEIENAVRKEALQLLYFGIGSLLITMTLVYLLINKFIIMPVRQVSEQAGVISAGNLEQQIIVHGHDEIARLGQSVNKMAESLKANIAKLQEIDKVKSEFMMITSHNLRTPLTIISGYLENMKLISGDAEKLAASLERIGSSVKRLEVFAEDVLTISRLELGDSQFQSDSVKLGDFMTKICNEFLPTTDQKGLKFTSDIRDSDTALQINAAYVRSAIWNILDNAAKFTEKAGEVLLRTEKNGDNVDITITDTGAGISADEIPKLFTKFHRGTSTLTYDFEGTGIGLYASKVMIEKHGGTIDVKSELGKGSTFTIHLPITPTEKTNTIPA